MLSKSCLTWCNVPSAQAPQSQKTYTVLKSLLTYKTYYLVFISQIGLFKAKHLYVLDNIIILVVRLVLSSKREW